VSALAKLELKDFDSCCFSGRCALNEYTVDEYLKFVLMLVKGIA